MEKRSALQQEVVNALVETKAIDLDAMSSVIARFGPRALLEGESLATIINHNAVWNCGYPGIVDHIAQQVDIRGNQG